MNSVSFGCLIPSCIHIYNIASFFPRWKGGEKHAAKNAIFAARRYHSRYLKNGKAVLLGPGRSGRRNENSSVKEESAFLARFTARAESGGILEVSAIERAYERIVGHAVPKSTVYRMLARQGWRKIAPRAHHSNRNLRRQNALHALESDPRHIESMSAFPRIVNISMNATLRQYQDSALSPVLDKSG